MSFITTQALQKGWDCPFAYLLCSLAASSNLKAMTQLVGRILRQPHAEKTGVDALNECHIVTHHAETASVVEAVKQGLERDGLGDLVLQVGAEDNADQLDGPRRLARRAEFAKREIYLPRVMVSEGGRVRELDYETNLLCRIDWRVFDPLPLVAKIPSNAGLPEYQLQRITISHDQDGFIPEAIGTSSEVFRFDPTHAVRMILDIVPIPFVGRDIVGRLVAALRACGFNDRSLGRLANLIVEELRRDLRKERDARAETLFKAAAADRRIQFHLRLDGHDWRMPFDAETTASSNAAQLLSATGRSLRKSLFVPVYQQDFNADERKVAVYLDGDLALKWWHRNAARSQYGLQGWQDRRIYPDFVFSVRPDGQSERITIIKTKGDHLDNIDTDYKRNLLASSRKAEGECRWKPAMDCPSLLTDCQPSTTSLF